MPKVWRPVRKTYPGGQVVIYPSIKAAACYNHISTSGMRLRMTRGSISDGYRYEYEEVAKRG